MLPQSTIQRIQKDAEKIYPYASVNFETFTGRNDLQKAKSVAYIAGATVEAERAQGLVSDLQKIKKSVAGLINASEFIESIDEALTKYNNPK